MPRWALALEICTLAGCGGAIRGQVVRSIRIEGAHYVEEDRILEHIATEETPEVLGLFRSPWVDERVLDPFALQRDVERVVRYYQARGYYDARVVSTQVIPVDPAAVDPTDSLPEEVDVVIRVEEGRPVLVRSVVLEGTEHLDPRFVWSLREIDRLKPGEVFDERDYDRQKAALTNELLDAGYARAAVTGEVRVQPAQYAADATFTLASGVQCTLGEIRIEGLQDVDEDRVRAAIWIEEGQPYSATELVLAQRDVYDLGVFASVDVRPDLAAPGSVVPVVISVRESDMRRLRAGGGAQHSSDDFEIHLVGGWQHRNLFGGMQSLDIEDKPGYVIQPSILQPERFRIRNQLEVAFRWPGVPEARTDLFHNGYYRYGPPGNRELAAYDVHDVRLGQGFTRPLTRNLRAKLDYHFEFAITDEPREASVVFDDFVVSWLEEALTLDLRDSVLLTREGALLSVSVGEKPDAFFGRADFYRLMGEARGYLPLAHPVYLAGRLRAGRLFVASTSTFEDMPQTILFDFMSGGTNSNRGYPFRAIRPRTCVSGCGPAEDPRFLIGGLVLWEASLEVRWELPGPFRLVGFADAADAFLPREGFAVQRHHLAVGPGWRWDSLLGAVRADLGFRLPTEEHPEEPVRPFKVFGYAGEFELNLGIGDAF